MPNPNIHLLSHAVRKKRLKASHTVRSAPIRSGAHSYTRTTVTIAPYNRALAMKLMCTECLGFEADPRSECTSPLCPLYPFRGKTLRAYVKKSATKPEAS
jgi:hypothetical protein